MRKDKYISLTQQQSIHYQDFVQIVKQWVKLKWTISSQSSSLSIKNSHNNNHSNNKINIQNIQNQFHLKYNIKKMKNISIGFFQEIIIYSCLKKFYWIIINHKNKSKEILIKSNYVVKQLYQKMIMEENLFQKFQKYNTSIFNQKNNQNKNQSTHIRNQFNFQYFILICVKIVCHFMKNHFDEILIDSVLEGDIYIILIYLILGIDQGHKSYEIIAKKFIQPQYFIQTIKKEKISSKSKSFSRKQTDFKLNYIKQIFDKEKLNQYKMKNRGKSFKKLVKKATIRTSFIRHLEKQQEIYIQKKCFLDQLKKNLYVPPMLPKVKQKIKARLIQLDHQKNSNTNLSLNEYAKLEDNLQKRKISSTQLSSSMHLELKKLDIEKIKYQRGFLFVHKPQYMSSLYEIANCNRSSSAKILQKNISYIKKHEKTEQISKIEKASADQWKKIINRIKQQAFKKQNLVKKAITCDKKQKLKKKLPLYDCNQVLNQNQNQNKDQLDNQNELKSKSKIRTIQNKDDYIEGQNNNFNIEQPWRYQQASSQKKTKNLKRMDSKNFKNQMDQFQQQIRQRDNNTKSSIFSIQQRKLLKILRV